MEETHLCTFEGLKEWYKNLTSKFGWMILAKHNHEMDKIDNYLGCCDSFVKHIGKNANTFENPDKSRDLELMRYNIEILAQATIKLKNYDGERREMQYSNDPDKMLDMIKEKLPELANKLKDFSEEQFDLEKRKLSCPTFVLQQHYKELFCKLHYLVFAHHLGIKNKRFHFAAKIVCLIFKIDHNIKQLKDADCIRELSIIRDNLYILAYCAYKFHEKMTKTMSKSMSKESPRSLRNSRENYDV